jgi:hypothetical protein
VCGNSARGPTARFAAVHIRTEQGAERIRPSGDDAPGEGVT